MRASFRFTGKSIILSLTATLLILAGCAPRPIAQPTPFIPQTGPTEPEPTVELTEVASVEPTKAPTEAPLQIALTAVSFTAKVFKDGKAETDVEEDQQVLVEPSDRIEVVKLENQEKQSYSILDFQDFLKVELFTNAVVLLQDVREEAGGSTHVTLNLSRGHMFVELTDESNSRVTVETPDATINTLEAGTEFRICKAPDSLTCAQVKKGSVEIIAQGKKETVRAGEASFIFKDAPPSPIICAPNDIFAAWEEQYRQEATTPPLGAMVAGLRELCGWQSTDLPPQARKLYDDQFTNPLSGWLQEQIDNYFIGYSTPEYYHIQIEGPGERAAVYVPKQRTYEDVNVDLSVRTGNAKSGDFYYGVLLRRSGEQYYGFAISPVTKTWYVLKGSSEGEKVLKEATLDAIQGLDIADTLRVVAKGPLFTFFINGQLIYQLFDADYTEGEVGLFVETVDSPSALVYFDYLTLWTIPEKAQVPVANSTPLTKENCFNNRDDDGDHFVDRDDPDCNRPDVAPAPGSITEPAQAGCTDPKANNFNPSATSDDGSCTYDPQPVPGCTDPKANNFNPNATVDDGSCKYDPQPVPGCTDPKANNFNPNATVDDGSCTYDPQPVPGCTDPNALNFDPNATVDDGSCEYESPP